MRSNSCNIFDEKAIEMKINNQQMKYNGYDIFFVNNGKYIVKFKGILVEGYFNSFENSKLHIDKLNENNRKNKNG